MRLFVATLCLALCGTVAAAGEIYGTIREGGRPLPAGTKLEVKCPKGTYSAETDKIGAWRLFAPEQGKCTLTVRLGDAAPSMTVSSFEDSARYALVLEKKDGKYTLRSE